MKLVTVELSHISRFRLSEWNSLDYRDRCLEVLADNSQSVVIEHI